MSRQMSEDRSRKVAIICKDVPTKFNNHMTLRNHFCRYGKVTKVFPNPAKMQATIHFERHVSLLYDVYVICRFKINRFRKGDPLAARKLPQDVNIPDSVILFIKNDALFAKFSYSGIHLQ